MQMIALKVSGLSDIVKRAVLEYTESVGFFKKNTGMIEEIGEVVYLVNKREPSI